VIDVPREVKKSKKKKEDGGEKETRYMSDPLYLCNFEKGEKTCLVGSIRGHERKAVGQCKPDKGEAIAAKFHRDRGVVKGGEAR